MQAIDLSESVDHVSNDLEHLFNQEFTDCDTRLIGGAEEPFYAPAERGRQSTIFYTRDYFASALHEVSHWCIAGAERRKLEDYGYWYEPDGRTAAQQQLFEKVEVKPQALEWILSVACGYKFRLSADNLNAEIGLSDEFKEAVYQQVLVYCQQGVSSRPARFIQQLAGYYGVEKPLSFDHYSRGQLEV